jgi:hypothetical protein
VQLEKLTPIINCFDPAYQTRGQTVIAWGKDQTGQVEYTFNNQGFRSDTEYDWQPDVAFFGNSIIFGIGLPKEFVLTSQFTHSHNYGLAGTYLNKHSVENLRRFVEQGFCKLSIKIVFFWIERPGVENIPELIKQVDNLCPNVLHISSGNKYPGCINLMPHIDRDASGTHPGPKTHAVWAKAIKLLLR